jgi:hypothetical protein
VVPAGRPFVATSLALVVAVATLSAAAPSPPPPLSAETGPASIDSSYGSGGFGAWHVDATGLPALKSRCARFNSVPGHSLSSSDRHAHAVSRASLITVW